MEQGQRDEAGTPQLHERLMQQACQMLDGPAAQHAVDLFLAQHSGPDRPQPLAGDDAFLMQGQAFFAEYLREQRVAQEQAEEHEWITRTLAGDQEAYAKLIERYSGAVYTHAYYRLGNAHDAEDAVQEVFYRAYTRLHTFDQSRRFRAWVLAIASNYCTDVQRGWNALKRQAQQWINLDDVDYWLANTDDTPDRVLQQRERDAMVRHALQRLPDKYREVLTLFYWNDLSYQEIIAITGLPESTVKTHLRRGRLQLKKLLEGMELS